MRERLQELADIQDRVEVSPSIRAGEPVFRGTRIPVYLIAKFLEQGIPRAEVLEDYPALDEDALEVAATGPTAHSIRAWIRVAEGEAAEAGEVSEMEKDEIQRLRRSHGLPAPDLVQRRFSAEGPDQLWIADITHIPTQSGFLYLALVLDAWSRRVLGWAMATRLHANLVIKALDMALAQRRFRVLTATSSRLGVATTS